MRIAICDDYPEITQEIDSLIKEVSENSAEELITELYYSGKQLLIDIANDKYFDIYFLDIKLDGVTGIDVSRTVRDKYPQQKILIYFVSSYPGQYCSAMFETHANGFLDKPIKAEYFKAVLTEGLEQMSSDATMFFYKKNKNIMSLENKDISYIESNKHYISVFYYSYGKLEEITYRGNLSDAFKQLHRLPTFVNPSKSYIVNLKYVKVFGVNYFLTYNDKRINISRDKSKTIEFAKLQYMRRQGVIASER